jgi:Zn-dependent peptidase ImmA (M78 family)
MPRSPVSRRPGRISPETQAAELLKQLNIDRTPVPVEDIAAQLGVKIAYQPFRGPQQRDISGMLYRDGDLKVIGVNMLHSPTRQRFTISHEIGHYLLHPGQEVWIDQLVRRVRVNFRDQESSAGGQREEIQANRFAAALLMPERRVITDTIRFLDGDPSASVDRVIRQMANQYQVSQQAMEYRLVNLGLLDPETS